MDQVKRYEGPFKVGMKVDLRDSSLRSDTSAHVIRGIISSQPMQDEYRRHWVPVRPADDDRDAWALFLPDAPLPDTGPKEFKVGQVWATYWTSGFRFVFAIRRAPCISADVVGLRHGDVKELAGEFASTDSNGIGRHSVLLFDADAAPTAAPVKREPVERNTCGLNVGGMSNGTACNKDAGHVGNCSWSLERGPRVIFTVAEPRIAPCGRCAHWHIGPCAGRSPSGEFACPCGHATEAKRPRVVGTYERDDDRMRRIGMDRGDGYTLDRGAYVMSANPSSHARTLLANLARERPPGRREIKVAARYAPGANLEEP